MSGKYSQKLLYHDKQSATYALKTSSRRVIPKTNNSETITNEHDK